MSIVYEAAARGNIIHLAENSQLVLVHQAKECRGGSGDRIGHVVQHAVQREPQRLEGDSCRGMRLQDTQGRVDGRVNPPRCIEECCQRLGKGLICGFVRGSLMYLYRSARHFGGLREFSPLFAIAMATLQPLQGEQQ